MMTLCLGMDQNVLSWLVTDFVFTKQTLKVVVSLTLTQNQSQTGSNILKIDEFTARLFCYYKLVTTQPMNSRYQLLQSCSKYTILPSAMGKLTPEQKRFIAEFGTNPKLNYPGKQ